MVGVAAGLRKNSGLAPALMRPSQSVMVMPAGRLSANHTDTRLGSTRRRIGPARTNGRDTRVALSCADADVRVHSSRHGAAASERLAPRARAMDPGSGGGGHDKQT